MARKPMVTRTITTTIVTALCLDLEAGEPINRTFELPRTQTDKKTILKTLKKQFEVEDKLSIAQIVDISYNEKLYGMTEEDFIAHAEELPARAKNEESEG